MHLIPERFREACRRIDRSQAWVGRKAFISKQRLQNYLNGRDVPSDIALRLIGATGDPSIFGHADVTSSRRAA